MNKDYKKFPYFGNVDMRYFDLSVPKTGQRSNEINMKNQYKLKKREYPNFR